ncbi:MAG TPA: hypothetical protein VNU47_01025 [Candidatus Paceibacterota bacterium]|nr:hypothetical protein [Candidatus Paceibacterota bacterium]
MMKKLWFKAKTHGWGWYPSSWEGWAVTGVYAFLIAGSIGRFTNYVVTHTGEPFFSLLFPVLLHALWVTFLLGSLLYICIKRGEEPKWRWD